MRGLANQNFYFCNNHQLGLDGARKCGGITLAVNELWSQLPQEQIQKIFTISYQHINMHLFPVFNLFDIGVIFYLMKLLFFYPSELFCSLILYLLSYVVFHVLAALIENFPKVGRKYIFILITLNSKEKMCFVM